jgi:uncharacterized protein YceK
MKTARPMVRTLLVLLALVVIAGCASTRTQESAGQYTDSSVITAKVKAAIFDDKTLKVLDINVETFKDVVQLSGFVNSAETKNHAAVVASRVSGVKSVKNDLIIKGSRRGRCAWRRRPAPHPRGDADIRSTLRGRGGGTAAPRRGGPRCPHKHNPIP